ncbi:MAG TPA: M42 family peptidase [Solirubrobacteraceae bacterium]|jgi:putative aminopeptidase FrvX|nr:M42 family peptidase [Solirubrobacteraceae bacterium]
MSAPSSPPPESPSAAPGDFPRVLRELLAARGPSGYETAPAAVWAAAAEAFGAEVSIDVVGTPSARVAARAGEHAPSQSPSAAPAPSASATSSTSGAGRATRRLMVMGHIDEIGLIVTHIDDEGYLWFREVGGWDAQILVGQRVVLGTRDGELHGVIGKKPIHLLRDEERKKVAEVRDLHIDIGARDGEQARELVRVGDVAVIAGDPLELPGGRVASRALDNRLGSFVALETARLVVEGGGPGGGEGGPGGSEGGAGGGEGGAEWELVAVAAAQEETTFGGSRTSAFAIAPDAAIVVDVTHATDAPGIEVKDAGKHPLGSGPVISRGSTLHPRLFELLHDTAEREGIPFTVEAIGRNTGTDADAVHLARGGIPTALVSIPLRYMHSPVELVELADVHATARLIAAAARALSVDFSLAR